ncbi:MAG: class I SAM-dependent methyltransferase [Elusimicrobia bacterium]|nr:class I SAM-dependent methyltransferase [Elusimicrobiota bacterium]
MELTLKYRSRIIMRAYEGWLGPSDRVLDVGCGNGVVTDELARHFSFPVVGTDSMDYRKRKIAFEAMREENKLPFADGAFDACMLNDVLHHCTDWRAMLFEALRVGRRVLIFELEATPIAKVCDWLINKLHNPLMNEAIHIKHRVQWEDCLQNEGLTYDCRNIGRPALWYPFSHFAFKVAPKCARS